MKIDWNLPPLPKIPPGTPPSMRIALILCVVRETERGLLVCRNRWMPGRREAWLPSNQVTRANANNHGGEEKIVLPVWLYNRIREQLLEDGED